MACKLRDAARAKFKDLGLSYKNITENDIHHLGTLVRIELARYLIEGGQHALQMDMTVAKLRKKDIKITGQGLVYAKIEIDGSYFERREGITFSTSGFIGIGGEFSDCNVKPILDAFMLWCDYLKRGGEVDE